MKKVHMAKANSTYMWMASNSADLSVLSSFLAHDVASGGDSFKAWARSNNVEAGGNISDLEREGARIYINNIFAEKACLFVTTSEQLFSIIEQWQQLYKQQPAEIIISQHDDGNISLTGIFDTPCHTYGKQN